MILPDTFNLIFEKELLEEIEKRGKLISVPAGNTLLEIGQVVQHIPILVSGTLKITRTDESGRELLLYYVNANESCAMTFTCCMQNQPSEIKATAEDDAELVAIPMSVMDEWLVKYPTWKSYVMKTIRGRFLEMLKTLDQVAFQRLDERLVNYLREKSKLTGSRVIHVSHEEIANDLATTRVVISRLLKRLEDDKKLLLYRHEIKLLTEL